MYLRISVEVSERRAERDHQPGGVPGGARGQAVALEQDDVLPAHVGQVVGDGAADDAAADDDDAGAIRNVGADMVRSPWSRGAATPGRHRRAIRQVCWSTRVCPRAQGP